MFLGFILGVVTAFVVSFLACALMALRVRGAARCIDRLGDTDFTAESAEDGTRTVISH